MAVKHLVDEHFPEAPKIILVMDNLNMHTPSSLYERFSPEEAKRILNRLTCNKVLENISVKLGRA
jgi:hypothetical protein